MIQEKQETGIEIKDRTLGEYSSDNPEIQVVFLGGIHGNEPAGVFALERVLETLNKERPAFQGKMIALAGNIPALEQNTRYVDVDLNRIWHTSFYNGSEDHKGTSESLQKRELEDQFKRILSGNIRTIFIDLHTTSSESKPFMAIGDTLRNRKLAKGLPIPLILGFEEHMKGTLFNFFNYLGVCSILFEAGQHQSPASVDAHEAIIWMVLVKTGCVHPENVPEYEKFETLLGKGRASVFETIFRYEISEGEGFEMYPGFFNFQKVKKGLEVARNSDGPVRTSASGRMFLPLYQKQGNDGYFIIKRVRRIWLKLSSGLRKLKTEPWLNILPGVRKHPVFPFTYEVDPKVAFLFPRQFFHLFGYKKLFLGDDKLIMARRRYDTEAPRPDTVLQNLTMLMKR